MGKKSKKFTNSEYDPEELEFDDDGDNQEEVEPIRAGIENDDDDDDNPSDLEVQQDDMEIDEEEREEINLVEELEEHEKKIKKEFKILMSKRGGDSNNWLETMTLTTNNIIDTNLNIDDDIKRELAFYNMTTQNVIPGLLKLKENKVKINRPGDFFAEMLKSDKLMERVKGRIIKEQVRIKKFEEKKQKLQNIKYMKTVRNLTKIQIKDFKNKEQAQYKKNTREGVEKWKQRKFILFKIQILRVIQMTIKRLMIS